MDYSVLPKAENRTGSLCVRGGGREGCGGAAFPVSAKKGRSVPGPSDWPFGSIPLAPSTVPDRAAFSMDR